MLVTSFSASAANLQGEDETLRFYIGTATSADKGGVFLSSLSLTSGKIAKPQLAAAADRSTFICLHPTQPVLYSVAELNAGEGGGAAIVAWQIEPVSGKLTQINRQLRQRKHIALSAAKGWSARPCVSKHPACG